MTNPKDVAGAQKAPLRYVPPALDIEVAPVLALGARKYGPFNWRGQSITLETYLEAIERHCAAVRDGEWIDPESGRPHVAHIGAGAAIVLDADAYGTLDRSFIDEHPGPAARLLDKQNALGDAAKDPYVTTAYEAEAGPDFPTITPLPPVSANVDGERRDYVQLVGGPMNGQSISRGNANRSNRIDVPLHGGYYALRDGTSAAFWRLSHNRPEVDCV
jgi:hypothetical protein